MDDLKYERILQAVTAMPWAILPAKLAVIQRLLMFRAAGGTLTAEEVQAQLQAATHAGPAQTLTAQNSVAVLPLIGTVIPRGNLFTESSGAVSVQRFRNAFRQAMADPDVGAIVLDVDSPGGQVGGVPELAAEILNARGAKPITAVANTLAASAAYWIASAADELVVTPSGQVGGIGVFAMHEDFSGALEKAGISVSLIAAGEFKTEGNPYEPLTETAREAIQDLVDDYYDQFVTSVARGRGVTPDAVREGFGQGRVLTARDALDAGVVDRVATLDDVITGALDRLGPSARGRADDLDYRQRRLRAWSL